MREHNVRNTAWIALALTSLVASPAFAQSQSAAEATKEKLHAKPRLPNKPFATTELVVKLKKPANPNRFGKRHGLQIVRALKSDPNTIVFGATTVAAAMRAVGNARKDPEAEYAGINYRTQFVHFGFVPNDPYYNVNTPSAGWPGQWHLFNGLGGTIDARLPAAWALDRTGLNVVIGIVDDSLERDHTDLNPNFSTPDSFDFGQLDPNPSPVHPGDEHGTSVAGVAAARGGNGIGVTGAAPFAKLAGLRIDFPNQTSSMFVDATQYRSSGGIETIKIKNHSYGYGAPFIDAPLEQAALENSGQLETIHVFAAGNGRSQPVEDSNTQDLQNSPSAIAVAALGQDGLFAHYSSFGANVFVCAPSSSSGDPSITTTDVVGINGYNPDFDAFPDQAYTSQFGGTSSASPLVAGILALAKQANPTIGPRMAKHLLAMSTDIVDPTDVTPSSGGGWRMNAAGYSFNPNYGFGLIDAGELVQNAIRYQAVTPIDTVSTGQIGVGVVLPDSNGVGVTRTFPITRTTPLEEVQLTINATHPYRGDLDIWLRSPSGMESRLKAISSSDSGDDIHWTFISNAFWGENPQGTWTVWVRDMAAADIGTWDSFGFTARMGRLILKNDSDFVSLNVPTSMVAGQTYTAKVSLLNNGYSTWIRPTWYLRSENPGGNNTWGITGASLAPIDSISSGIQKNFSFKVFAPMDAGAYNFQWRMRQAAIGSFGDFTPNASINVTVAANAARFLTMTGAPVSVAAGASFPVTVTMRNVGTNPWTDASGHKLRAATSTTNWGVTGVSMAGGDNVTRGGDKSFSFMATAPVAPGTYTMQWRMHSGSSFFGDPGSAKSIIVAP